MTSISPTAVPAGTSALTLTVNGTGFLASTAISVNGTAETTTYVSGTQVTAVVPAAQLVGGGTFAVVAANGTTTSGSGTAVTLEVDNPVPAISGIAPNSLPVGAAATTVKVTGTGFVPSTVINVSGTVRATTFVSGTQLTVQVTAADTAAAGGLSLLAVNPSPQGGSSGAVSLAVNNPAPGSAITVSPSAVTVGSAAVTATVTGTGFVPSTVVQVGGSSRATAFLSATQVTFQLTAADQATAATLSVSALTPAPGGGSTAAVAIAVNNPAPGNAITVTPNVVTVGTAALTMTVTGTAFVAASVAQVGGATRATTFVSPTQLTFQLTAADRATVGTLVANVMTPAPGGGTTASRTLIVQAATATPVIASVSPSSLVAGSADSTITVSGSNLYIGAFAGSGSGPLVYGTVQWNGAPLATTLYGSSYFGGGLTIYLEAKVPAALLATAGTASVTVSVPTAGPALSNALSVSITNPPAPTLTSLSPNNGPVNQAAVVTLYGTGFTAASTVAYNGTNLPVTTSNAGSLVVTLPASSVAFPGNGSFTVTTPAPGGGTTAALTYTAYVGIVNNSMVYNPINGLVYVSVPGSAGAPYGNSVVSVDPATGALGTPIFVGSEPNKLAITSDGKYLWVGLDGASAVRKVDLTAGAAGLQFTLGGNLGVYANPGTALALAALPGATDSVVVSATSEFSSLLLAIYDGGVVRGAAQATNFNFNSAYSLAVDGTRGEVYAASQGAYYTYTYGATGLTLKASSTNGNYANYVNDEIQIVSGKVFTDFGGVYDAESGSLLGTFYSSGLTQATGSTTADGTLGEAFVLDSSTSSYGSPNQVQVFNTTNYTLSGAGAVPVNLAGNSGFTSSASRLTRWGANGLAFRTSTAVYSLRSNLVKDLSGTVADLGVTVSATGSNATGANSTYVATVTNAGPAAATNVELAAFVPSTGVLVSVTPSAGTCSTAGGVTCDLGGLASGGTATVTLVVTQTAAGSAALMVTVAGSENDTNAANNQATSTLTIAGSAYGVLPTLTAISPASVLSGATDTTVTVTGTGFTSGSTVQLNGVALVTSYVSGTSVTATVPAANLTALGWAAVTVKTPAPGGGVSGALPLTVYSVITLGVNHILYDPYTRKIMASVGSGSSTVTGNSIAAITPETATVGTAVNIGSQPTNLALTSDGQILYTILTGSESVARFNMLTQAADFAYAVPGNSSFAGGIALRGIATQPGTENTVALDIASFSGNAIYDFDPIGKTATIRGQASGPYSGSCIQFLDAGDLLGFDTDTSGATLDHYKVASTGFTYYNYLQYTESTLNHFGCFKLSGGVAFAINGGVANPAVSPAKQLGYFNLPGSYSTFGSSNNVAPDASLQQTFFGVSAKTTGYSGALDSIAAYNNNTYLPAGSIPIGFAATEGSSASYSVVDLIRWGQDGLAVLTSGGHIYLLRGAAVVPQLLQTNTAAVLSGSSVMTVAVGAGNTLLTLTGSNFVPGVAVTWNGGYRTTTIVDATHVAVAIPAADLATAGTGSLVATNPGGPASGALSVTVQ